MISDNDLYFLAIFLGSCAMMMIVLYHFLEVNAQEDEVGERTGKDTKTAAGSASVSNNAKTGNMAVSGDGVPLAATAAAAGGSSLGGGKGR